ncbi:GM26341 [Drosophila sechellia]|uniref:GM26341 n=1 Tax=Drosophila sechellia TaxID=7238 RepID=B4HLJ8_DROSE|nr:GM26341 [Drosophila sechellia]
MFVVNRSGERQQDQDWLPDIIQWTPPLLKCKCCKDNASPKKYKDADEQKQEVRVIQCLLAIAQQLLFTLINGDTQNNAPQPHHVSESDLPGRRMGLYDDGNGYDDDADADAEQLLAVLQ